MSVVCIIRFWRSHSLEQDMVSISGSLEQQSQLWARKCGEFNMNKWEYALVNIATSNWWFHCLNGLLPWYLHLTSTHPSEPDLITILIGLAGCVGYACCEIIICSFSDRQNCLWYMGRGFLVNHWIVAEALYWSCSVFSNLCHDIHDIIVNCSGLLHQLMMRNWGSEEIIRLHVTDTLPSLWDTELRSVWVNRVLN